MLSTTRLWGQKLEGKEDEGNLDQSSTLNPLGRYSRSPEVLTLLTKRNLRFPIFSKQLAFSCNFVGSGEIIIMPRIYPIPN